MFRAYIDESAESGNAVFAVGGFAGREEEWTALEPLWLGALPACIDYFHATDCFGRRGQFANMGMTDRIALLDRLTDLVLDRNIRLVAGVMDVPAYEQSLRSYWRTNSWGTNMLSLSALRSNTLVS